MNQFVRQIYEIEKREGKNFFFSHISIGSFLFIVCVSLVQTIFFYGVIYPEYYINGDNEFYGKVYGLANEYTFREYLFNFSKLGGSGSEPVSSVIFYLCAQVFPYQIFFYLVNIFFVVCLGVFLSSLYKNWKIILVLTVFSFYVFIVGGLTKRLAIAISLLFLSFSFQKKWKGYVGIGLALLSHFQVVTVLSAGLGYLFFARDRKRIIKPIYIFCLVLVFSCVLIVFQDVVIKKFLFYMDYWKPGEKNLLILLWPIMILIFCHRLKYAEIIFFALMFIFSLLIGSQRLNLLCFFSSLYFMRGRQYSAISLLIFLSFYFLYKHYDYFVNFYKPGQIFGGV